MINLFDEPEAFPANESGSATISFDVTGFDESEPVRHVELRLLGFQYPSAEAIDIFIDSPGGFTSRFDDVATKLRYNVFTANRPDPLAYDGDYTFVFSFDENQTSIWQQYQKTSAERGDIIPPGEYAPSEGPLLIETTLLNRFAVTTFPVNGEWQVGFSYAENVEAGSLSGVQLAINEDLPPVDEVVLPTQPTEPTEPTQPTEPSNPAPTDPQPANEAPQLDEETVLVTVGDTLERTISATDDNDSFNDLLIEFESLLGPDSQEVAGFGGIASFDPASRLFSLETANLDTGLYTARFSVTDTDGLSSVGGITIGVNAVPTPSAAAAGVILLAGLGARRRKATA